jgi:hypothetical protein
LQRLPLRAIAAYAARAARRVEPRLRGAIDCDIIEHAVSLLENVASSEHLDRLDVASALLAASRAAGAAVAAPAMLEIHLAANCITGAAMTAYHILESTLEPPERVERHAAYAADAAEWMAACADDVLGELGAGAADAAAQKDYEILLKTFGEHDVVTIGDRIDLSETSLLGPIM